MSLRPARELQELLTRPDNLRLLGQYTLIQQIGKGGFAPVWLAKEVFEGTELMTVAIKLFAPSAVHQSGSGEPRPSERFGTSLGQEQIAEEARALCQVEHPNVVKFYSMTPRDPTTGVVGLVMEYVRGTALDRRLAASEVLSLGDVVAMGSAMASALAAVHEAGLVHRDVKPANIVDTGGGTYKLIDFGIASAEDSKQPVSGHRSVRRVVLDDLPLETVGTRLEVEVAAESGSRTSVMPRGTRGYVDPYTLANGTPPTPASDLYALGVTMYECLTGALPSVVAARDEGSQGLKAEVVDGRTPPPPVAERSRAPMPEALARLIDSLVDPDPQRRPGSAEAVVAELDLVQQELGGHERVLPPETTGPFAGLKPMGPEHADVFFGRAAETTSGIELLRSRGLLTLVGEPGCGKRSLARAGIGPRVIQGALGAWPKAWDYTNVELDAHPRDALLAALEPYLGSSTFPRNGDALVTALAQRVHSERRGLVLVIERLELLPHCGDAAQQDYVAQFVAAAGARPRPGLRVIATLRRDRLDELLAQRSMARAIARCTLLVPPLSVNAWTDVLDQALSSYDYDWEDTDLRDTLQEQLQRSAVSMPLTSAGLAMLWARRGKTSKVVTRAAAAQIGGIHQAFGMQADAALARLEQNAPDAHQVARGLLLSLVDPDGTVVPRPLSELSREVPEGTITYALETLSNAGIVVQHGETVALGHEALAAHWRTLRAWLLEERERRGLGEEDYNAAFDGLGNARLFVEDHLLSATGHRSSVPTEDATREGLTSEAAAALLQRGVLCTEERGGINYLELSPDVPTHVVRQSRDRRHYKQQVRRQRRRTWIVGGVAAGCAAALCATWYGVYELYYRVHEEYYAGFDKRYGVWVGQLPLTEDQVRHRKSSLKLVWRGHHWEEGSWWPKPNPPHLMVAVDSRLQPTKEHNVTTYLWAGDWESTQDDDQLEKLRERAEKLRLKQVCQWEFAADPSERNDGTMTARYERALDCKGQVVYEFAYQPTKGDDEFSRIARFVGPDGFPLLQRPGSSAEYVAFKYDEAGREAAIQYRDGTNKPVPGRWGTYGEEYEYNEEGRQIGNFSIDREGNRTVDHAGNSGMRAVQFDGEGNTVESRSFGPDGELMAVKDGYSIIRNTWDSNRRLLSQSYFDAQGEPVFDRQSLCHRIQWEYDEAGNAIVESCFGTGDNLTRSVRSCASWSMEYDAGGHQTASFCHNVHGKPSLDTNGVHGVRRTYDERGNELTFMHIGLNGKPIRGSDGVTITRYQYDAEDHKTYEGNFDAQGKPVVNATGVHSWKAEYDRNGNRVFQIWLDCGGKPVVEKDSDLASLKSRYDERGNEIERRFFGPTGEAIVVDKSYHGWRTEYDERGNETRTEWFGFDSEPAKRASGYSSVHYRFDTAGNKIDEAYYGLDNELVVGPHGYAHGEVRYNEFGARTEAWQFGAQGQPIETRSNPFHRRRWAYNPLGYLTSMASFARDGHPGANDGGVHQEKWTVDLRGNNLKMRRFGKAGEPVVGEDNTHGWNAEYNKVGDLLSRTWVDVSNTPVSGAGGYSKAKYEYDARGRKKRETRVDTNGKRVWQATETYDELGGATTVVEHFTRDEDADWRKSGCAKTKTKKDFRGNLLEEACYGPDGKPTANLNNDSHRLVKKYDPWGREVESAHFGTDGKPVVAKASEEGERYPTYHKKRIKLDPWGRVLVQQFLGADGKPLAQEKTGCARISSEYDSRGHLTSWACYGTDGKPTVDKTDGTHEFKQKFDAFGRRIHVSYYGPDKHLVLHKKGYATMSSRYDRWGREVEEECFDTVGKRTACIANCARPVIQYAPAAGEAMLQFHCYDANGDLAMPAQLRSEVIVIKEVIEEPAKTLRLKQGDVLWSYGGWSFRCPEDCPDVKDSLEKLLAAVRQPSKEEDKTRKLVVLRNYQPITLSVDPGWLGVAFDTDYVDLKKLRKLSEK